MLLKIVTAYPPNYEAICKAFPAVRSRPGVIFAYGDAVYMPSGGALTYDLQAHEATHLRQQSAMGARAWWAEYLASPTFRLRQEAEAYHAQYIAMSKADREKHIRRIAGDLCGPIYGGLLSFAEAKRLIREGQHALQERA